MNEWSEVVQKMINWIEDNLTEESILLEMSRQIGYSPFYCSVQFHEIVGSTLKNYVAGRRLCRAALDIRDTDGRIIDIAMKNGFSSQQSLTRAFVYAYGCTPAAYRKKPTPVPLRPKKEVLFPEYYENKGEMVMSNTMLTDARVKMEYIPAHKYIAIFDPNVQAYFPFWEGKDCDEICGLIESMEKETLPVLGCHTAGWFRENEKTGYSYGFGVPADYAGPVPEGFEVREYPESYYLVFYHPPFDFLNNCKEVMERVEKLAQDFNPASKGFEWNEENCQDYQRHYPETTGYEVLRPVKLKK